MAIINCSECNKEISDKALSCPHCGVQMNSDPKTSRKGNFDYPFYLLILIIILSVFYVWWALRPQGLLVGTWVKNNDIIDIYSDGTLNIKSGSTQMTGTYQLIQGHKAKIELGGVGALLGPVIISYEVSVTNLIVNDGKTLQEYKRTSKPSFVASSEHLIIQQIKDFK